MEEAKILFIFCAGGFLGAFLVAYYRGRCWHKWAKWKPYLWEGTIQTGNGPARAATEGRQKRSCLTCGQEQDEKILGS
jgi:hypothetical protein